jgi:Mini-chromosome maintenance replisome factor
MEILSTLNQILYWLLERKVLNLYSHCYLVINWLQSICTYRCFRKCNHSILYPSTKRVGGIASGSINPSFFHSSLSALDSKKLLNVIKTMTPTTALIQLNIDSLNNSLWMQPHQNRFEGHDYGLCRGELQAPDGTLFLLDECQMDSGTLLDRGVHNFKALEAAINWGIVDYGLHYGSVSKECDFRFMVLGKTKSILSLPFSMPLVPDDEHCNAQCSLQAARYIQGLVTLMNSSSFEIEEEMENLIHDSFVKSQQLKRDAKQPIDDGSGLLNTLILAENIAKSFGLSSLDEKSWKRAEQMELERKGRA